PDDLSHPQAHVLDAVDDHVRPVGKRDVEVGAAHEVRVGVPAGLAEGADGDEHARAGEVAAVDRHAHAGRTAGRVPHSGEAGVESPSGGADRAHQLEGRGRGQLAGEVESFAHAGEVDVAVDEAGQECEAARVYCLRVARNLGAVARACPGDLSVLDE